MSCDGKVLNRQQRQLGSSSKTNRDRFYQTHGTAAHAAISAGFTAQDTHLSSSVIFCHSQGF
ncbi:MAG TPA: hypothetical protein V6C57_03655 [Coleofasciculaceae cyanobacterium]